ncbi:MBL fold metallo-hydrolase [Desulfatibacillum aliphaticivorans]|uniref:MBL fold metallo-hydrolase n=1 Tax=Desulfatibacillum aliphaticivorans TaxID=218208 RepID=UPI0004819145|nr:MBL fold metallo-hydrolase [Desulfatibacillum aliphaticivorans]
MSNRKQECVEQTFGPVRFLPGPNRGKYPHCHSLFVEEAGVLIDPASDRERLKELRDQGKVQVVWLTHWHEDHIAHLDLFDDLPLWICEEDALPLSSKDIFCDWYALDQPGMENVRAYWMDILESQFHFKPRKPARLLVDGETINLGNVTVDVIHAPGHTPGHTCFYFREPGVLLLGDYDLTPFGPWYGDVLSSIEQTEASVKKLRQVPAKVWTACHETGLFTEQPGQVWDDYLQVIRTREDKLLSFMTEPRTMEDVIGQHIVYLKAREPKEFFEMGERAIMGKHLESLIAQGRAVKNGDYYELI